MFSLIQAAEKASLCSKSRYPVSLSSAILLPHRGHPPYFTFWARALTSGGRYQQVETQSYDERPVTEEGGGFPVQQDEGTLRSRPYPSTRRPTFVERIRDQTRGKTVTLGVDALGKPAQIRIVRDLLDHEKRLYLRRGDDLTAGSSKTSLAEQVDSPRPVDSADLLQTIAAETGIIDESSVSDNIEQLRRKLLKSGSVVDAPTLSECQMVAQQLHDGFTASQLESYLTKTKRMWAKDVLDLTESYSAKSFARSRWFAGTSAFPYDALKRLDPMANEMEKNIIGLVPDAGKTKQTVKQHLTERILRFSWKAITLEERQSDETDIFKSLALQYGAKIDISRSHGVVRLTADLPTCYDLFKLIHFALDNIHQDDLSLVRWKLGSAANVDARRVLNDKSVLEHLEKLTSTLIAPIRNQNIPIKLRILSVGPGNTDFEDVRRLVLQVVKPNTFKETQVLCALQKQLPIQVPIPAGLTLPWGERATSWMRWRNGVIWKTPSIDPRISESKKQATLSCADRETKMMERTAEFFFGSKQQEVANSPMQMPKSHWCPRKVTTVTANIGLLVYPEIKKDVHVAGENARHVPRTKKDALARSSLKESIQKRRVIVPSPEMPSVLQRLASPHFDIEYEMYVRLSPVANDGESSAVLFPEIDMRITIDSTAKQTYLREVRLITQERVSDILLPEHAVDVQFDACSYIVASPEDIDPRIVQFVNESNFNVWGADRLKTPSRLRLSIPKLALRQPDDATKAAFQEEVSATAEAEYAFASMDHRSHMTLKYQGFPVIFTTIEAGQSGGRRDELRLQMPDVRAAEGGSHSDFLANDFGPFYNVARDFVRSVTDSDRTEKSQLNHQSFRKVGL